MKLMEHQLGALSKMRNGCVLCGKTGSGKSLTGLAYFYILQGGNISYLNGKDDAWSCDGTVQDLYIITTAKKRDDREWEKEFELIGIERYGNKVVVDSWSNIKKYTDVTGAFFIFDEQRVAGDGVWVKSFLTITKHCNWILLSATPGDEWKDYIPLFIANGFYKNRTDFVNRHVIFSRFAKYPKIEKYTGAGILSLHRRDILLPMDFERQTVPHHNYITCEYDTGLYRRIMLTRYDTLKGEPIWNAAGLCSALRRVCNSSKDRVTAVIKIVSKRKRVIIFYNFDYELEILRKTKYPKGTEVAEWNGKKHESLPIGETWVYLVQYTAGNEGWNCTTADTIIFYSQQYSYKVLIQASGRIDRINTPFRDLYYYHLVSSAKIDIAIRSALKRKRDFNERAFEGGKS